MTPEEQRLTDLVAQHVRTIAVLTEEKEYRAAHQFKVFAVLDEVAEERWRQNRLKKEGKFPWTCADEAPHVHKLAVLAEEFGEVAREVTDLMIEVHKGESNEASEARYQRIREELIQVAAVAVGWVESISKR